jgi:hypothetical protein
MTGDDKNLWREQWLSCINELTSLDLQKKSWLDKTHTNPHWSFVEFMSSYFDDLAIDDNYKSQLEKEWVTKEEFEIIENWHIALENYKSPKNDHYDNEAILNDNNWTEILQIGMETKNELGKTLNDTERHFLTEEIDYLKYI